MQAVVTSTIGAKLRDLGFDNDEITAIDPSFAAVVIRRGTRRPGQGMPREWRRAGPDDASHKFRPPPPPPDSPPPQARRWLQRWPTAEHVATDLGWPDMRRHSVLVTGCTAGIGWHTAKLLAELGATTLFCCRDEPRAQDAAERMRAGAVRPLQLVADLGPCELADLGSVRQFASRVRERAVADGWPPLSLLVLNAGEAAGPSVALPSIAFHRIPGIHII